MSNCPGCGESFGCGMVDGKPGDLCWCARLPIVPDEMPGQTLQSGKKITQAACYCPDCLRAVLAKIHADPR